MSRIVIVILIYHRHKPIHLIYELLVLRVFEKALCCVIIFCVCNVKKLIVSVMFVTIALSSL
jgi:hypothetical protein